VSADRPVVVYDAATSMAAARAWWLLRYFGHPQVAVLNGGLRAWVEGGYPVSKEPPSVGGGDFAARAGGMRWPGPARSSRSRPRAC
jgi:thiosulfate/3-mercaptopyruvate sulfurtransferase